MPTASNLSLNNAAAVAKVFTLLAPSGGLGGTASLHQLREGAHSGVFPTIKTSSRASNRAKTTQSDLTFPSQFTDTTTGLVKPGPAMYVMLKTVTPDEFPENVKNDPVAFVRSFVNSTLFEAMMKEGVSGT